MPGSDLLTLFLQIILIMSVSRAIGYLFNRLGQPEVLGEMLGGLIIGPSFLKLVSPRLWDFVFPGGVLGQSSDYLRLLGQVGVVFLLFLIGLQIDPRLIRRQDRRGTIIAAVGIVMPIVVGIGLAIHFAPTTSSRYLNFSWHPSTALFLGTALAVTAFPTLARVLTERTLLKTPIGSCIVACAAMNDLVVWYLLAAVMAVLRIHTQGDTWQSVAYVCVFSSLYIGVLIKVVRPLMKQLDVIFERHGKLSQNVISIIILLILLSSYITHTIGLHAFFGAFIMGAIMPRGSEFVRHLSAKLEDFVVIFLIPIFLAYVGLHTDLSLIRGKETLQDLALVLLAAYFCKAVATTLTAKVLGKTWRDSAAIGALLNTRGLMCLIVLDIGRESHIFSQHNDDRLFTILVIVTIITTLTSVPLFQLIYPRSISIRLRRASVSGYKGLTILIPVAMPKSGGPMVELADTIIGSHSEPVSELEKTGATVNQPSDATVVANTTQENQGKLIALHLRRPADHATFRTGLDEQEKEYDEALAPLLAQARARAMRVESLSFVSRDVPYDICQVAAAHDVDLVMMGFHKPLIGQTILGGTVHKVLTNCQSDVAIFVDRGFRHARKILVPYLGTVHDRLALEIAAAMAQNADAQITVLQVVAPLRDNQAVATATQAAINTTFGTAAVDNSEASAVQLRIIEDPSPVGVVLHQAPQYDLLIIGIAEEWGLESHLIGWRTEKIARGCPSSLLIVRKHVENEKAATAE